MQEQILTVEQVAQILQIHPFTVLKFIKQGKLVAAKLGRVYRIRSQDLDGFLEAQLNVSPKPKKVSAEKVPEPVIPKTELEQVPVSQPNPNVEVIDLDNQNKTETKLKEGDHYIIKVNF